MGVSGTDRELLRELEGDNYSAHSHQVRTGLGAIILLTFLVTWASLAWMATTFEVGVSVAAAIGLLGGLIKLAWDRRVAVAANAKVAWWRMGLALPISILLAIPLALSVFGEYATGVSKEGDREDIVENYQERLTSREAVEAKIDSLRSGQRFFQTMASAEVGGLTQEEAGITDRQLQRYGVDAPSETPDCGPRCETYRLRAQNYASSIEAAREQLRSLPTRTELKAERDSALAALDGRTTGAVTRLSELYNKAFEFPLIGGLFLVLVLGYTFIDLLPALERIFSADPYTKAQVAKSEEKTQKRKAEQWGPWVDNWLTIMYYDRILDEAKSSEITLEKLEELKEKLEEAAADEEAPGEGGQPTLEVPTGDSAPRTADAGAPSPDKESSDRKSTNMGDALESDEILLPPFNGQTRV